MATRSTFTRTSGSVITSAWANSLRDHIVPYSGAADGATDGMLSVNTSTDTLHIGNGTIGATFGCYGTPPTWSLVASVPVVQNGFGGSASLAQSFIVRQGREVRAWGEVTITGGPISGEGFPINLDTNLPASSVTNMGTFMFLDSGNTLYTGIVQATAGGTGTQRLTFQVTGNNALLGQSPNFRAATNDEWWLNLSYITTAAV